MLFSLWIGKRLHMQFNKIFIETEIGNLNTLWASIRLEMHLSLLLYYILWHIDLSCVLSLPF